MASLREQFPIRLFIGGEDMSFLLDSQFSFSNVDPGGFESASFQIARDLPQIVRGMPIRIDTGLKVAWEGRVKEIQRSLGNRTQITGEGNAAILKDQQAAEIFVDRDLTRWTSTTLQQQIERVKGGYSPSGPEVATNEEGTPALVEQTTGPWVAGGLPMIEGVYDAQGIPIGSIHYEYLRGKNLGTGATNWSWDVILANNALQEGTDVAGFTEPSSGNGTLTATAATRVYAILQLLYSAAGGASNTPYAMYWQNLAVYGRHGLTKRGTEPGGFYPQDIAGWVEQKVAAVQAGTITGPTSYIVPHYVQLAPVTMDTFLNDMAIQGACTWGVWEAPAPLTGANPLPRLDFHPRPELGEWTAYCKRQDCDTLDLREDLSGLYNRAVVTYSRVDGTQGTAEATFQNPLLEEVGLERTIILNGGTMTPAAAETFGRQALELLYTQARVVGTATLTTSIDGPSGPTAPWLLKAGVDRLRIGDMPSVDAFGIYNDLPISRVTCDGSESGFTTTIEFGAGGASLQETLQARLATAATLAAVGG